MRACGCRNIGGEVKIDTRRSDIIRAVNVKGLVDLKGHGQDVELQDIDGQVTIAGTYSGVIQFRNISKPLRFNGQQTDLNIEKLPGRCEWLWAISRPQIWWVRCA